MVLLPEWDDILEYLQLFRVIGAQPNYIVYTMFDQATQTRILTRYILVYIVTTSHAQMS